MEKQTERTYRLDRVTELEFKAADNICRLDIIKDNIRYQYGTVTKLRRETDDIEICASLVYYNIESQLFSLKEAFVFQVDALSEIVEFNEQKREIIFKSDPIPTFLDTVCGTMRGILIEKAKGTAFEPFPLPLMSIQMLMDMNTFEIF